RHALAASGRTAPLRVRPDNRTPGRVASEGAIGASALYGTPEEIARKLEFLRAGGAAYILVNCPAGAAGLRRFAQEVRPSFDMGGPPKSPPHPPPPPRPPPSPAAPPSPPPPAARP